MNDFWEYFDFFSSDFTVKLLISNEFSELELFGLEYKLLGLPSITYEISFWAETILV
jgi:hypothetical protein